MRTNALLPALIAVATSLCQPAMAEPASKAAAGIPAYTADDIVKQFAPDLGATRGLCIGTEKECPAEPPKAPVKATFDLVVTFDYNSDGLTPMAKRNLDEFARALRDQRLAKAVFMVEGHTDAKGSEDFNLGLSERRANAVVRYLGEQGIDGSHLRAKGYGKLKPRTPDPLDPANRRVETRLRAE